MSSEKARVQAQEAASSTPATSPRASISSSPSARRDQDDQDPPQYFDSEPSSQPPSYHKHCGHVSPSKRNSGPASAASIAAILGPPPKKHKRMSLKERWRDLFHDNSHHSAPDGPGTGSADSKQTWNIGQVDFLPPKKTKG
ncbi:hypothetical protein M409DRAFT_53232 [Zasmidium cellare ATCC 36951]|uniref:Uncharacterized protein n=1 Tax=Zasmidium cellare ATCC 36951 TaxID=1080233 RepID=A0A6A6CMU3_ZASCE|nr:uncharacterized protein M409DRAFT_53232 [Zasmidium cellare ATCC 36951]KAF2168577.1 hypothetical protein M409DRAFT_53232 [Zasmidium cellare ATCC 36951]